MPDCTTKRCAKCNAIKPLNEFSKNKASKDGLSSACKKCTTAASKKWKTEHPDYQRKWSAKNPDYGRRYYLNNREKMIANATQWQKDHPQDMRVKSKRREAKARNLPATLTVTDWLRALEYFNGGCAYCGNPPSFFDINWVLQMEHHVPLALGGAFTPENIVPACQTCNFAKHAKDPVEWCIARFGARRAKVILARITAYFASIAK